MEGPAYLSPESKSQVSNYGMIAIILTGNLDYLLLSLFFENLVDIQTFPSEDVSKSLFSQLLVFSIAIVEQLHKILNLVHISVPCK